MKNKFSTIKERVVQLVELKQVSKENFFSKIGSTSANFRGKPQKTPLNSDTIVNILSEFPDVNVNWLLTGEGEMIKPDSEHGKASHYTVIPVISIDAAAGYGSGEEVVMPHHIAEGYVIPEWTERGVAYIIRVSGNSMYPTHSNGDLLGCRPVKDLSFFQWGKIYVLDTDQGPLVKRLYPAAGNAAELVCHSDNKDKYPPFSIPLSSIYRIAIVVGFIRFE